MPEKKNYIAIFGALSQFQGFGDIIASSENFYNNREITRNLWNFDTEFKQSFKNYENTEYEIEDIPQNFFFPKTLDGETYFLGVRAQKQFTKFPEQNRFYDRREYFFCDFSNNYDVVDFVKSLPAMKQYEENANGKETFPTITKHTYSPNTQISTAILSELLSKGSVRIKVNKENQQEVQNQILNALSAFPACYKKYLGFGFNVKDDTFTNSNLHIFTTLDESGIELSKISNTTWIDCATVLFLDKNKDADVEIELLKLPINRNTLYKLLEYHKFHYQVDNNVILENEDLDGEILSYFSAFIKKNFAQNNYIKQRIEAIILYLCRHKKLDITFYEELEKQFAEQNFEFPKDTRIQNYIADLYNNRDYSKDRQEIQYKALADKNVSDGQKREIIERLGLEYLDKQENFKELLIQKIIFNTVTELLASNDLETKLQWRNKYSEVKEKLKIETEPSAVLTNFQSICKIVLQNNYEKSKDFVQKSIDLQGDRELEFYSLALDVAIEFDFKISLKQKEIFAKGGMLFEFYKLFNKNRNYIESKDILNDIAKNYIENELKNEDLDEIFKFAHKEQNFLEEYKMEIIACLAAKYKESDKQFNFLKILLLKKENLFLKQGDDLYKAIENVKLDRQQCIELYEIGAKLKQPEITELIDYIINANMSINDNQEEKKPLKKMKNIIANSTKKMKNIALVAVVLCLLLTGLTCYFGLRGFNHEAGSKTISNVPTEQQKPDYRDSIIDSLRNEIELRDSLVPYPNSQLSVDDLNKLYKKGSKTANLRIDMSTDSVIDIIFKKNPKSIGNHYSDKKKYYKELLNIKNPDCFSDSKLVDSLSIIPNYKQKRESLKNEKVVDTNENHN